VFDSMKPNEAIVLKKNPNYWGGDVYLDEVRFILVGGQDATYEALKANTAQLAYIRDPRFVAQARDDGNVAFESVYSAGDTMLMNNGVPVPCKGGQPAPLCTGQADGALVPTKSPFSDKRLRQAAAAAIDLPQLDQRLNQGKADYNSALFAKNSRWYAGTEGPKYDLDTAKKLVSQVKAEGNWDGTVRVRCSAERSDWGIAIQTMLQAAGFTVQLTQDQDTQATITAVIVNKDFDAACWGTSISDAEPWFAVNRDFNSKLTGFAGNWVGYSNPQVDAALANAQSAKSDADKKAALDVVSKAYAVDVPFLVIGATNDIIAARQTVHGVTGTAGTDIYLDKVWLE
jgi:peptide/nickel transport system substrate-binding protein